MNHCHIRRRIGNRLLLSGAALLFVFRTSLALAGDHFTMIVPYSPGNGLDLYAREVGEALSQQGAANVVVENREGAGGVIGTLFVTRAPRDGSVALMTANPPYVTAPLSMAKPPYEVRGLEPVARIGSVPLVLVSAAASPFADYAGMIAYVRSHPDKATYASAGVGSPGQLYGRLLERETGLELSEIAYRATMQGLLDVMSGNVLVSWVSVPAAAQHVRSGSLRVLAVGSRQRLAEWPQVPTIAELTGNADFQASVWYGVLLPAGTPGNEVSSLSERLRAATQTPRVRAFMKRSSITPEFLGPAEFARALDADLAQARSLTTQP